MFKVGIIAQFFHKKTPDIPEFHDIKMNGLTN